MSRQQQYIRNSHLQSQAQYGNQRFAPPSDVYHQPTSSSSSREGEMIAEALDKLDTTSDALQSIDASFDQFKRHQFEDTNKIIEDTNKIIDETVKLNDRLYAIERKLEASAPRQPNDQEQAVVSDNPGKPGMIHVDQLKMATDWQDFAGDRMPTSLFSDWKWWTFFTGPMFYPAFHPFFRGGHKPVRCRVEADIKRNQLCHSFATLRKCRNGRCQNTHICPPNKWDLPKYEEQYWWQIAFDGGDNRFSRDQFNSHMQFMQQRKRPASSSAGQPANSKKRKRKNANQSPSQSSVDVDTIAPACIPLVPGDNGIFMDQNGQIMEPQLVKIFKGQPYCESITGIPSAHRTPAEKQADFKATSKCRFAQTSAMAQQLKALTEQLVDQQKGPADPISDEEEPDTPKEVGTVVAEIDEDVDDPFHL
jgi:hypothetical protein